MQQLLEFNMCWQFLEQFVNKSPGLLTEINHKSTNIDHSNTDEPFTEIIIYLFLKLLHMLKNFILYIGRDCIRNEALFNKSR